MHTFTYKPYTYPSSLTLRRIRLLKILPPTRSSWPPFRVIPRVQIVEYDLDPSSAETIPPYEALSYTWETRKGEKPTWLIHVETTGGTRSFLTFRNLYLALCALWDSGLNNALPIFVDQICINQQDIPEREFHVALMGELYSHCARVVVWLGPGTAGSDALFEFANAIGSEDAMRALLELTPRERADRFQAVIDRSPDANAELLRVADRFTPEFPIVGYADVLKRSWFTRLWIIQEAALAPTGVLLCGDRTFTFDDFRALFLFHSIASRVWNNNRDKPVSVAEMRLRDSLFQLEKSFVRIFGERMAIHYLGQRRSLYELVKKYSAQVYEDDGKTGATEAEDRIFGLLGLAELDGPMLKTDIGNPKKVYTTFAAKVIQEDPDILCFSQGGDRLKGLPSWVPDWSLPQIHSPYGYAIAALASKPVYTAGGSLPTKSPTVDPNGTLHISGVVAGKVIEVGKCEIKLEDEPLTINNYDLSCLAGFFGEIDSFLEKASTISGAHNQFTRDEDSRLQASLDLTDGGLTSRQFSDCDPPQEKLRDELRRFSARIVRDQVTTATYTSFWRTLDKHWPQPGHWVKAFPMLSIFPIVFHIFDTAQSVVRFWIHLRLQALRRRRADIPVSSQDATDPHGILDMSLHRTKKMYEYNFNIFRHYGRKLYITDSGLVGLGPAGIAKGDVVVIIPGGTIPHIIRPARSSSTVQEPGVGLGNVGSADPDKMALDCTYVGEAYCHGVMDGELLASRDRERVLRIS